MGLGGDERRPRRGERLRRREGTGGGGSAVQELDGDVVVVWGGSFVGGGAASLSSRRACRSSARRLGGVEARWWSVGVGLQLAEERWSERRGGGGMGEQRVRLALIYRHWTISKATRLEAIRLDVIILEEDIRSGKGSALQLNDLLRGLSPSDYVLHAISNVQTNDLERTLLLKYTLV
ncbi:uncharacterized protein A4U43_C03F21140 [Asparagus officinalis]|uniref:Uncharacterized protein n=1 Tax=Asparagus officinalis TaxID=4686 RepID=A0A5P1FDM5_ASPOF|nr:uncharacterized protein A4U43_C03F21140 [Asparagus officinalis]